MIDGSKNLQVYLEPPSEPLLFADMARDFHGSQGGRLFKRVDQPLERHIVVHGDNLWLDDELPYSYAGGDDHINPIQH